MSNLVEELKTSLTQRIDSSVLGTITISFIVYNWQIMIYAFDGQLTADTKIESIRSSLCWDSWIVPILVMIIMINWYPNILEIAKGPTRKAKLLSAKRDIQIESEIELFRNLKTETGAKLVESLIYHNKNLTENYRTMVDELKRILGTGNHAQNQVITISQIVHNFDNFRNTVTQASDDIGEAYQLSLGYNEAEKQNRSSENLKANASKIKLIIAGLKKLTKRT